MAVSIMTIREMIREAAAAFSQAGIESPRLDAEVLLARCLGVERLFLYTNPAHVLTEDQIREYRLLITRRMRREPVAYIVGFKEFWSLSLDVDRRVLIPRPETEILVEEALKIIAGSDNVIDKILDVGAGSGAIGLALASSLEHGHIFAVDISLGALRVARQNAEKLGLAERISFIAGNMTGPFSGKFDMIVSNPPYIAY
ncbi:MAG: peptide chain release factor N(5)-glutamine methyltransferase, partial [Syntrophales bacterium]|nr:peptide chain release factor N(5)-glutamine methyltransferase [Syntrophales bacterium]